MYNIFLSFWFSHFQLDSYSIPSLHCFSCQLMSIDHFQIINIKKLCTIYQLLIYSAIGTPLTTFCFNATLCVFVLECAVLQNLENSQTLSIMPLRFLFNIFYRYFSWTKILLILLYQTFFKHNFFHK